MDPSQAPTTGLGAMPIPSLPTSLPANIPWTANNNRLQWLLLTEIELEVNFRVLFGKKTGSTGENKVDAHRRIAAVLFPEYLHIRDATKTLAHRVGVQITSLVKKYKEKSKRLRVTGGGLGGEDEDDDMEQGKGVSNRYLKFYITGEGPAEDASDEAKNLWAKLEEEYAFFPRLHRLLASKPNVEPYAITTGVGPAGAHTTFFQPPPPGYLPMTQPPPSVPPPQTWEVHSTSPIQPAPSTTDGLPSTGASAPAPRAFGTSVANGVPAVASATAPAPGAQAPAPPATQRRGPKTSAVARESIENAKKTITPVKGKSSYMDQLVELQRVNMEALRDRDARNARAERRQKNETVFNASRQQMFEEFKAGLLTQEEYRAGVADTRKRLMIDGSPSYRAEKRVRVHSRSRSRSRSPTRARSSLTLSPPPRISSFSRSPSPEWGPFEENPQVEDYY